MNRILIAAALLIAPVFSMAKGLDLALSNETAYLAYYFNYDPLYRDDPGGRDGGSEVSVGGFINETGDSVLHATVLARGFRQSRNSQYHVSAGMKLIGGEIDLDENRIGSVSESDSVGALALGFQAGLLIRPARYNPIDLRFEGFYAPSITSFSDAERYGEISARLQIEIMTRARAFIGYRRMRFDTDEAENIALDRAAHVGLSITF